MPSRLSSALLITTLLLLVPVPALAQDVQVEQSVSVRYGNSLTFNVRASAGVVLTGARLTIQIAGRDTIYSQPVTMTPGMTVSVSQTITVNTIQLPPFATISYYWDFQDDVGREYRSETQTLIYEDNLVPWEWHVTSQSNVVIHTDGDQMVSRAALDIAIGALAEANHTLGVTVAGDIHVYVYPELSQLAGSLRMHRLYVQDWVAAYALPEQGVVMVSASPGPELLVNLQRDLPHEIVHTVIHAAAGQRADNVPGWLSEGLALMSAAEPDPTLHDALDNAVHDGVLLSLETLCVSSFSSFSPHDATLAYAQSESVMRYVTNRYGTSQVRALVDAYANGLSCSAGVDRALGISLAELEGQWHNDLRRVAARTPRQNISLIPWFVVWAISLGVAALFVAPQPYVHGKEQSAWESPTLTGLPPVQGDSGE